MIRILYVIQYLFVFTVGVCIGSFLNVLVYRIPRKIDFVKGRSFCPACGHPLGAADLAPLFSWLLLGRKCRYCSGKISARYPAVELAGGLLALLSWQHFGPSWQALVAFAACGVWLTIALIDADTQEIPDGLVIALASIALASAFAAPQTGWTERLIGMVCVSVPMLLINLAVPTSFGGGDIKMMAAAGLLLGWKMTLVAMFIALLTGGGYGVWLLASKRKGKREHFAFGPFLAAGCGVALFAGQQILSWYLTMFL